MFNGQPDGIDILAVHEKTTVIELHQPPVGTASRLMLGSVLDV